MKYAHLPPERKIEHYSWNTQAHLGSGSYGKVYLGKDMKQNEKLVAIKIMDREIMKHSYLAQALDNEINLMKKVKSPFVVELFDVFYTKEKIFIITEFCNGGDLRHYLEKKNGAVKEEEAQKILSDMMNGLHEMMKLGIVHRDLKPENVLCHDGIFKIADFGFAKEVKDWKEQRLDSYVGTPLYMAPQILKHENYTVKSDLFSVGQIYYEMLYGKTPWEDCENECQLISAIETLPLTFPYYYRVSDVSKSFLRGCLKAKESERFSWDEALAHPILQKPPVESFKENDAKGEKKVEQEIVNLFNELKLNLVKNATSSAGSFDSLDKQKDNVLDIGEFTKLVNEFKPNANTSEIEGLFKFLDSDSSQSLTFGEFQKILAEADLKQYDKGRDPFLERKAVGVLEVLRDKLQKAGEDLKMIFAQIDKNSSGDLSLEELSKLINVLSPETSERECEYVWQLMVKNTNKTLCFEHFKAALEAPSHPPKKQLRDLPEDKRKFILKMRNVLTGNYTVELGRFFKTYDKDKTEKLNRAEFSNLIKMISPELSEDFVSDIFSVFDGDNSGDVNLEEFKALLLGQF